MSLKAVNGYLAVVQDIPYDISTIDYKVQVLEQLVDTEAINETKTNASKSGACYSISYDNENITVVGNNITISSTPSFTVAVGDLIRQGTTVVEITAVSTQTQVTVDDGSGLSTAAATITQAVHTSDLNAIGSSSDKTRAIDVDTTAIDQAVLQYFDDTAEATGVSPNVAAVLSSDGFTNSTAIQTKPELSDEQINSIGFGTPGTDLRIKFFSNITIGEGSVRLKAYKISFHQ